VRWTGKLVVFLLIVGVAPLAAQKVDVSELVADGGDEPFRFCELLRGDRHDERAIRHPAVIDPRGTAFRRLVNGKMETHRIAGVGEKVHADGRPWDLHVLAQMTEEGLAFATTAVPFTRKDLVRRNERRHAGAVRAELALQPPRSPLDPLFLFDGNRTARAGDLPKERVEQGHPFFLHAVSFVGCDGVHAAEGVTRAGGGHHPRVCPWFCASSHCLSGAK